ncbi:MAG: hydroxyacid dehydrogenase [Candidatus Diapherotrites archaeon]|nr:hydroxyacid dehydrogenase [Candidatus Diapherotrites archaeon]
MQKPKTGFFEIENEEEKEFLKALMPKAQVSFFSEKLSGKNAELAKDLDCVSVFITSKIDSDLLEKLPALKLIATRSTGFDHIAVDECKKRDITVCNVPSYGENTVAEHTFGLILNISRKIHLAYEKTIRGDFSIDDLRGFDLAKKTLGVVGVGKIGKHVIRIAKGFEMNVVAFDVKKDPSLEKKLGFRYVSFEKLLSCSDIISLHAPYNKHTHHLINRQNLDLVKKGAVLINTARGGLVETNALIEGLQNKVFGGAGLDVLEEEDLIKEESQILSKKFDYAKLVTLAGNHILLSQPNVIITPHNAFNSTEAIERILKTTAENITGFFNDKKKNSVF